MPDNLEETLKRMNELQIAFIAKLGDKVKELSRLILQLDGSISVKTEHNQQLLKKIQGLSHNLAGSAGTFKHTTVYNKAKAIENLSSELLDNIDSSSNWHKLLLEFIVGLRGDIQVSGRPAIVESFASTFVPQTDTQASGHDSQTYYPVIVVDDDELLVSLIKEQAKHFEYKVIPLLTTEDLEAAIDKHQPAAILIDVVFPDARHSGIEIINQLKAKHKINCPVIFMSNRCDVEVRLDALRAGSNAYIVKPLEILELIRVLDRLTQKLTKKKSRILIIDDDPLTARLYQTALTGNGFICETTVNPMDVINKALAFSPDAILLDINMPGCSGFELAEIIRQDDGFAHIPLLFLTATHTSEQEIHAMKSGGDDFLDKNADLSTLIAIIRGHVQRYKELDSMLARLKRDEVRFRSVTSSSSDAIISTDEKGRIVFWNEGAENIFGFSALETIGQPLEFIIPSEKKAEHAKCFESIVANKSQKLVKPNIERTALRKDKTQINVELTCSEWVSVNEKFYTAIIRDISHRKRVEQELNSKKASLDAIINSSGEAIITIDSEGLIETANPKAMQLFGYSHDELIGQNVSMLMPSPEKERHDDYLHDSELHTPRMINQARELNGIRKDGNIFALELNVSPMITAGKRKFVGVLHDISERKKFVNELFLAKAGAEAASKAKTQFLSSMSHEFRTPLNAILGFTQVLQTDTDYPLAAEQQELLDHIYNGGIRLLGLINDVLDLSKIEEEFLTLQNEKFALVDFINDVINQIKPLVVKADVTINNLTDENVIFVETDKLKLKQVLNNLLSNAIKYNSRRGTIKVFLTSSAQKVRLSISDTGKGIPEHLLPELFKPFSRLGAEVGTIEGTGIGLTLTKKLIEIMNGKIGVSSKVNEGTTFWIELERIQN
jgi:PAS domain S-box-containing protein